ncbi:HlyD family efflux transporter periplasmic adaptor subunit [Desulfobacterales bacterium HSG16]|nr:HlyD family efflux transporter periplasmic adaptor subunit [Desulfobacterales bacterium HSG16]
MTGNDTSLNQPPSDSSTVSGIAGQATAKANGVNRQMRIKPDMSREMVLVRFIHLCSDVLAGSSSRESAAIIVNRVSELVRADRVVIVNLHEKDAVHTVTGGGAAAQDSAFADAVITARKRYKDRLDAVVIEKNDGEDDSPIEKIRQAMGGTQILWLPLWLDKENKKAPVYALWLERWQGLKWQPDDVELLKRSALFFGHGLLEKRHKPSLKRWFVKLGAAFVLLVLMAMPITSSVTAPVRIDADRPHYIFAPMDGILKNLLVRPGSEVKEDDVLFQYDPRVLDKRLEEARQNVLVAKAKLDRLEGAAHRDSQARAELPVQKLEVERAESNVGYFEEQLARSKVKTAKSGVIVLDDPDRLIGAALQTGQAVLSVADPLRTKLQIMIPASDVGFVKKGAQVKIRLDSDPFTTYSATIVRIGFDIRLFENQIPSVMAEAKWNEQNMKIRPGQRGSAKIFGKSTCLGIQIMRKPVIAIRSITGF